MVRTRRGFTLLELVVVIAILAALAGLVLNKIDWVRRQATMAVGANTCGEVSNNIQEYLTLTSELPNGMDSLLDTTGAVYTKLIGTTDAVGSLPTTITVSSMGGTGSDKRLNSLVRMGMSFVNDHSTTSTNATDSGTSARAISNDYPAGSATGSVSANASANMAVVLTGTSVWNSVYPANIWAGTTSTSTTMVIDSNGTNASLVALGVGPGNSMNGTTMVTPPQYPGPDSNLYYYRYVALFAVYSDGRRAELKTVIEPFGRTIDSELSNFNSSTPNEVPPGSRTPE
ncbi:MAG TPA: type II secretion system protein [Pirellulales bacterium]|jgi:prepilin-type N-terminal cleavage/methylation domain-containing protein|nr:type II secretion system protein [Pirellulales bacterium]